MFSKNVSRKRYSNRVYPPKLCSKQGCEEEFIPSDSRQIYCCRQHQIDANNDRRKIVDLFELNFNKLAKSNRQTLFQVFNSEEYRKNETVHFAVLKYLNYDFDNFHTIKIDEYSGIEVKFCFEYGLYLFNAEKQLFKIVKIDTHEV
jgi:hypothetical protein